MDFLMSEFIRHKPFLHDEFARRKAVQFSAFLQMLVEAKEYSSDLATSPWEFSVGFSHACRMGVNLNDLQWMLRRNWIQCHRSKSELLAPNETLQSSKFIISSSGMMALRGVQDEDAAPVLFDTFEVSQFDVNTVPSEFSKPKWNVERRELSVSGTVVKRFRWPAPNQETILCVFAEEGWPSRIEDPLPQGNGLDPKRRLGDTIKCLNRNQNVNLIKFRGDGTGEGVLWDMEDF